MASKNSKRKHPVARIEDEEVIGPFPIVAKFKEYFVCDGNREKITKNLIKWLMGNNVSFDPEQIKEAIDFLFARDHPVFLQLLEGKITIEEFVPIFVPLVFFSQAADVLNPDEFSTRRKQAAQSPDSDQGLMQRITYQFSRMANALKWTIINSIPVPRDYISAGTLQGEVAERNVFRALQEYFDDRMVKDACLILHSHSFLYNQNFKEKDFIILNLTKGYIMVIEVKASFKYFAKAKEQLRDSKERVEAVFNSVENMSDEWLYVGLCYIDAGDCGSTMTNDFVINGIQQFDLQSIELKVAQRRTKQWIPDQHIEEFVSVTKILLFEAQGHPQAPLSRAKQIQKIDEDLDQSSAPENIFFWTPEQLSIVHAMDKSFMLLMGYYGCGKTVLLIERAEYLLRNGCKKVHFFIDYEDSGLVESLKLRFNDEKRVSIKTAQWMFCDISNYDLFKEGIGPKDHVIIDEAGMWKTSDEFLSNLKKFQAQVSSLWVALGFVNNTHNFDEPAFRERLKYINFYCPTLKHCLRNGQAIVQEALSNTDNQKMAFLGYFSNQVNPNKSWVSPGLFHKIPLIYQDQIKALKAALDYNNHKSFICIDGTTETFTMSALENAIPNNTFLDFQNKGALNEWHNSEKENLHLVSQKDQLSDLSGLEFKTMIYLCQVCLICGLEVKNSLFITRAKASLVMARYVRKGYALGCASCIPRGIPMDKKRMNIVWNEESKNWEIKQGISENELSQEDVEIMKRSSNLTTLLVK